MKSVLARLIFRKTPTRNSHLHQFPLLLVRVVGRVGASKLSQAVACRRHEVVFLLRALDAGSLAVLRDLPRIVLVFIVQVGRAAGVTDRQALHMLDAGVDAVSSLTFGATAPAHGVGFRL